MHGRNGTELGVFVPPDCPFVCLSVLLSVPQCCIQLAEGRMTPSNIPHQLLGGWDKGRTKHRRLSGTYQRGLSPLQAKSTSIEALHWMEILTDHSLYAKECCNRVSTCFCVALVI